MNPARGVVLASASKIRSQILENAGVSHSCDPAEIDERELKDRMAKQGAGVETVAASLAMAKADEVRKRHAQALVIGADQILECQGRWFDKPQGRDGAAETLRTLRGRTHRLISAVAVHQGEECVWRHLETASLTMREFSDTFLERYIDDASPGVLESVGAYRLEQVGVQLFTRIEGDYFTVLGLPLLPLLGFLRHAGALGE
ncbi:MAG: septum formation protein Maf [Rhodospirillaceae bacterium]|nr:septum formation protein Maf [Rhodospirillaceae bacterium]